MKDLQKIARKITRTLFFSQVNVSAGLIMIATVSSIIGAELSGKATWAGVPSAVLLLSAAVGALVWGIFMERAGRRKGLIFGLALGAGGSILAGSAIIAVSFLVFLAGLALVGLAQAAMQLGRYIAGDIHPAEERGRAIANVVVGGAVGAILGPLLVAPTGQFALSAGLNELAGPFGAALVLFSLAVLINFIWLKPEPAIIASEIAKKSVSAEVDTSTARSITGILRQPAVIVAVIAMIFSQLVMVMLMVITSLYMKGHGDTLREISLVFAAHTFGMFGFSIFSGRLADRIGRLPVIIIGSITLVGACLASMLPPSVPALAAALFFLGLGWNFCFVGGSTLLSDQLSLSEQPRMQGTSDLLVGLAAAIGSLASGFIFASSGYRPMGVLGTIFALVPFLLTLWWWRKWKRADSDNVAESYHP
ncbi:MFS transporter [Chloroflexota bacterium]